MTLVLRHPSSSHRMIGCGAALSGRAGHSNAPSSPGSAPEVCPQGQLFQVMWMGGNGPNGFNVWASYIDDFGTATKVNLSPVMGRNTTVDTGHYNVGSAQYVWITAIKNDGTDTAPSPSGNGTIYQANAFGLYPRGDQYYLTLSLVTGHKAKIYCGTVNDINSSTLIGTTLPDATTYTTSEAYSPATTYYFFAVDISPDEEIYSLPSDSVGKALLPALTGFLAGGTAGSFDQLIRIQWDPMPLDFVQLFRDGTLIYFDEDANDYYNDTVPNFEDHNYTARNASVFNVDGSGNPLSWGPLTAPQWAYATYGPATVTGSGTTLSQPIFTYLNGTPDQPDFLWGITGGIDTSTELNYTLSGTSYRFTWDGTSWRDPDGGAYFVTIPPNTSVTVIAGGGTKSIWNGKPPGYT
jgi:hypothetical protein